MMVSKSFILGRDLDLPCSELAAQVLMVNGICDHFDVDITDNKANSLQ